MPNIQSVVRLQSHANRTPKGRRSVTAARKLVAYLAYGRGRPAQQAQQPQRGNWYDQTGQQIAHEEVLAWVRAQGSIQEFTHQLILSVKETPLQSQEYNAALAAGEPFLHAWRLVTHADSPYPHAHAVSFGDEEMRIRSDRFQEWWLTVRLALDRQQQLQRERLLEQEAGQALDHGVGQAARYPESHLFQGGAALEEVPHRPARGLQPPRDTGLDLGWEE